MGKVDEVMNAYVENPARFAEIVNYGVFGNRKVIDPACLQELDSASRKKESPGKIRDVIKLYKGEALLVMIGIENQELINYVMPLRVMDYNVRSYERQRETITRIHAEKKDWNSSDEFVSGFAKEDRLKPVITLVVYYGKKPWDGARDLHGLLNITEDLEPYLDLIENYKIHLLEVRQITDFSGFSDELKRVFGFVKYQSDKEELKKYMEEYAELFEEVPEEDCEAIQVLADSKKLQKRIVDNREGKVTYMCKAIKDWEEENIAIGERQGKDKLLLSIVSKKITKGKTIPEIAETLEMSEDVIARIYRIAEKQIQEKSA